MQFRTELKPSKSNWNIDYNSNIISIGSCFSTNISNRLDVLQFDILNNPYGTVYNPVSIFRSLAYKNNDFEGTFLERDGKWVSFLSHSEIASSVKSDLFELLKLKANILREKLKNCDFLILTLGSAKVYSLQNSNLLVANCHKRAQNEFQSRILSPEEILVEFDILSKKLSEINPNIKIILTVSPVRYLSDSFEMNSISKATLVLACHKIKSIHKNISYFPAYELILDDLRDYRYYNQDLLHPNSMAIQYVFEKFLTTYFEKETQSTIEKVNKINKSLEHIPFNTGSQSYSKFLKNIENQITEIEGIVNIKKLQGKLKKKRST